ncbi:MAG: hypothetical protein HYX42_01565 [Polaromonas sp.]|uniref:hypothetical protein n=1 Tax=Polaromonas sp. TaxID=1869339 RepID=UPI0025D2213C|nr:hypothetical protein [Polaromonas sp.]MBI2724915.1 hypothetical protein [Polaromonas sp.]
MIRFTANPAGNKTELTMLLSTSTFRLELNTPVNFLLQTKGLDVNVERTSGQPFWMFSKERDAGTVRLWGFGVNVTLCRKQADESWGPSPL